MSEPDHRRCVACRSALHGEYCHACGEKDRDGPPAFRSLVAELLHETFDTDGRLLTTLKKLASRPGQLTVDYIAGRRKQNLGPAGLFVLVNVAFFFIQPLANINTFNATYQSQTSWYAYSDWAKDRVEQRLTETGEAEEEFEIAFNAASERYARTLIILQVPLLALGLALLQIRRRRYFIEHLVYSTHFYAAVLAMNVIVVLGVFAYWSFGIGNNFDLEIPFLLFVVGYAALSLRRVYDDGWLAVAAKSLMLLVIFGLSIQVFRLILFAVTLWSVPDLASA